MIRYNDALKKVKNEFNKLKLKNEKVELLNSINRILAEDIYADTDQPKFTNSAMDGYAINYVKGINEWNIIGEISAGGFKNYRVKPGEAVLIMTGSRIPSGANTVIPVEDIIIDRGKVKYLINKSLNKSNFYKQNGTLKGIYEVEFNSHSGEVRNLPSGVYFYQLKTYEFIQTKKMILMK